MLPASSPAAARLLTRPDIVNHKGRVTLLNDTLTQQEATAADLMAVRAALDVFLIPYLLVRGNGERPVLAVDHVHRHAVAAALVQEFAHEPFYARSRGRKQTTVLVADGKLPMGKRHRLLRLFRPRLEARGGLYFGAGAAVQLEFWEHELHSVTLPAANSITRRTVPTAELRRDTVELHGVPWPTLEHMFAGHAFDVPFPVDMVFSWVDGNSAQYQQQRRAREQGAVLGEGDDHEARFRHIDELKYALRSIHMFAPWIRQIFIATDSPAPQWLQDHPRVRIVPAAEHFSDPSVLPTHNSMAVESQLHHIPGLAEHYLYSNDDMFFGRPLTPGMFFSPGGVTRFVLSPNRIGPGENSPARSGFENSARVNRALLWERFGLLSTRHLEHSAAPFRKSVAQELEDTFPAEFAATAASTFRAAENISVTNSLYHYYALFTGRAVVHNDAKVLYVDTTSQAGLASLPKILADRRVHFLCLNDGSDPGVEADERRERVTDFLEKYFSLKAPWEV